MYILHTVRREKDVSKMRVHEQRNSYTMRFGDLGLSFTKELLVYNNLF